ncbi:hypothetical protein DKP76_04115 [Falsochrobactrum shanghaiense]|uniref:Uncharacterized protein n=1 Tax=Falsochrobactrum shanghaiense TaxID=2201899 RepID=A0A316JC95_9HYPH|nr:hypothetical protein DKP76_04115 [Falsochrobactrum shanghaiense]
MFFKTKDLFRFLFAKAMRRVQEIAAPTCSVVHIGSDFMEIGENLFLNDEPDAPYKQSESLVTNRVSI